MLSDTEMMERVQMLQTDTALCEQAIRRLEENDNLQWQVIEKIKESLTVIKVQLSAFGVVNTLVMAYIAYKLTKGT